MHLKYAGDKLQDFTYSEAKSERVCDMLFALSYQNARRTRVASVAYHPRSGKKQTQ